MCAAAAHSAYSFEEMARAIKRAFADIQHVEALIKFTNFKDAVAPLLNSAASTPGFILIIWVSITCLFVLVFMFKFVHATHHLSCQGSITLRTFGISISSGNRKLSMGPSRLLGFSSAKRECDTSSGITQRATQQGVGSVHKFVCLFLGLFQRYFNTPTQHKIPPCAPSPDPPLVQRSEHPSGLQKLLERSGYHTALRG